MILHDYFRSSASFRVRIALNLKGLDYEQKSYALRDGAQREAGYLSLNPQGLVPALEDGGRMVTQSLAIIEYLEETHPRPPLLPDEAAARARVRALALSIACDIHPLNNLRVLKYLKNELDQDEAARTAWYHHWIGTEFTALEARLSNDAETGQFCHGDSPGLADLCLVPQVYNAVRFGCDLSAYPTIRRIDEACLALPAFADALPENQPEAA